MGFGGGQEFENFSKKGCFLVSSGKTKFHHFGPPIKTFGKMQLCPPGKNPSDAHAHKHVNYTICVKIVLYYTIWQHFSTTPMR